MRALRVLLGAHTIDPARGGEAGIGWGWAESLAHHPRVETVDVLAHPMSRSVIEEYLKSDINLRAKLRFHWVLPDDRIDPWLGPQEGRKTWHRLLAHYQLWQRAAARIGAQLSSGVDVAHHVTLGNVFLRTFVSELGVPYVIGPVGGGQAPAVADALQLVRRSRDVHGAVEVARCLAIKPMMHRSTVRQRLHGAAAVFCANRQTLDLARRVQPLSELMIDGGIHRLPPRRARFPRDSPVVLWVGKTEARKDPLAALDVIEGLRKRVRDVRLVLAGDGWLDRRLEAEVKRRRLSEIVELVGRVDSDQIGSLYAESSALLFTSLRDTFGVQNLEAMSFGVPIVYRATSGVGLGDFACGASIAVSNNRNWLRNTVDALSRLLSDPVEWRSLSDAGRELASGFTWANKADRAVMAYESAVSGFDARNPDV